MMMIIVEKKNNYVFYRLLKCCSKILRISRFPEFSLAYLFPCPASDSTVKNIVHRDLFRNIFSATNFSNEKQFPLTRLLFRATGVLFFFFVSARIFLNFAFFYNRERRVPRASCVHLERCSAKGFRAFSKSRENSSSRLIFSPRDRKVQREFGRADLQDKRGIH